MRKLLALFVYLFVFAVAPPVRAINFEISNASVSSENIISVDINLTDVTTANCPESKCFFQGFLRQTESDNYFGFTKNNTGDWIPYQPNPVSSYILSNYLYCEVQDSSCSIAGAQMKFNSDDPEYNGPGQYELKFGRYTGQSNSRAGDFSNILLVDLTSSAPTPKPTDTPKPDSTETPTPKPTITPTPTPSPTKTPTPTPSLMPSPNALGVSDESVLGDSQDGGILALRDRLNSPTPDPVQNGSSPRPLNVPILAAVFIFSGIGLISAAGYPLFKELKNRYTKSRAKAKLENKPAS